ncbi:hypothetical protein [Alkalibaculum sporogenes]|uniref:hypothetical protein n=1 Tax=Alkalibaculum sporogenes TaxID=2655001 RepID=UPI00187B6212|nr:hypothetical protein [Alkalibaculum sporogenes]
MQFRSERLKKVLPNAEVAIIFLFFLQLITIIVLWSNRFAKRVNSELKALLITTEKIQEQNLDFNVGNSNIDKFFEHYSLPDDILKMSPRWLKDALANRKLAFIR